MLPFYSLSACALISLLPYKSGHSYIKEQCLMKQFQSSFFASMPVLFVGGIALFQNGF